jgi:hypothetical protein
MQTKKQWLVRSALLALMFGLLDYLWIYWSDSVTGLF